MIDTHCHLTDPRLQSQLPAVLDRAKAAGVQRMITIGTSLDDARACIALCQTVANVRCVIGIHPNYTADVEVEAVESLRQLATHPAVIALGETGLDYHRAFAGHAKQKFIFERQLALAVELNQPVVIHSREATDDCLAILRGFPSVRADFHCFTGRRDEARKILDAGYLLGFTGAVTFKKNDELRDVARFTPIDRLLVETDAPYLTPEPMRKQKTNEPSMVVHVARVVAEARSMSYDDLERQVEANAAAFFGWHVTRSQPV